MHRLSRRDFLKASGTTALLSQVPHLAMAKSEDGYIDLVAKESKQSLYYEDGPKSDLWSYNGVTPGPEIRVKQGEKIKDNVLKKHADLSIKPLTIV